jgi:four helix bundle protein
MEQGGRGAEGQGSKGEMERKPIESHNELDVYRMAFDAAMRIFEVSKSFPGEERYSLTDQVRRSSRSVCANLAEAWRKRRYDGAFIAKLSDAEAEAAETQTWIEFAVKCSYLPADSGRELYKAYDNIIGKLVVMITNPDPWLLKPPREQGH